MSKGELIAKEVSKLFKKECGPFGGEDPYLTGNQLTLHSQGSPEVYEFSDDGTVEFLYSPANVREFQADTGCDLGEAIDALDEYSDVPVLDLIEGKTDISWFMYLDSDPKFKSVVKKIKEILK